MRLARIHSAGLVLALLGLAVLLIGSVQADGGDPPPNPPPDDSTGDTTGQGSSIPCDTTSHDPAASFGIGFWDLIVLYINGGSAKEN